MWERMCNVQRNSSDKTSEKKASPNMRDFFCGPWKWASALLESCAVVLQETDGGNKDRNRTGWTVSGWTVPLASLQGYSVILQPRHPWPGWGKVLSNRNHVKGPLHSRTLAAWAHQQRQSWTRWHAQLEFDFFLKATILEIGPSFQRYLWLTGQH